ncbi:PKD domain-containing protein [Shivajiella indica]|uniref:PKD domain-containing protein n=1 Tax=Shivajiella indica TaxID=872115 RepID=A0ABW5B5K0_9BACT
MRALGSKFGFFLTTLISLFLSLEVNAQLTTIGREFFVGFMENHRVAPNRLDQASIIISAEEDASGIIQYVNNTINFSLKAGEQFVYYFPQDGMDIIHRSSRQIENKGVYVNSNGNISVHAFNFRERSADGTVILPLSSIGKDYWVSAHHEVFGPGVNPGSNVNFESTLLILAVEDETRVEIVLSAPSVEPVPVPAGSTLSVTLKRGESYQVKAVGDLTGTRVRVVGSTDGDCKNIAVFGGNKMTSVGEGCDDASTGDHLFQQIYPTFSWGKEYIHIPLAGRSSGEMVKILASENNTVVYVNGQQSATLNAGKFVSFSFGKDDLAYITATKPIAVTTFAKSYKCNNQVGAGAGDGDPTMITLSPNNQLIKKTVFSSVKVVGIVEHFVNILAKTESANQTVLDGINIGAEFNPVFWKPEFSYARVKVSEGSHTLSNPEGVIGYAYGSGFIESYGYSAGASLSNLNFETEVAYDFEVSGDKVACLGETGSWTILPRDPKFEIFEWTFGDGTEIQEGKTVDHLFENPGIYQIKIVALTGNRSCDEIEEAYFEVEVLESKGELIGPENVCPDIDEAVYLFENFQNTDKVLWEVNGGEILQSDNYSVKIKWGSSTPEAKVTAIPVTELGCWGKPIDLEVLINDTIEPGLAIGLNQICYQENATYFYEVKDVIPNRNYEWFIQGGEIISDRFSEKVEVLWGGIGTEGEIWYEEFSFINTSCGGESQKLKVKVNPPLVAEVTEITEFICQGTNEGLIRLNVNGGSGVYNFIWSHDPDLKEPEANGLRAGIYEVIIQDLGGCEISFSQLQIQESVPMELDGLPAISNASCFDSEDGFATLNIKGGVPPYRVDKESVLIMGSSVQLFNLSRGDYNIKVFDAAKCEFEVNFSVGSPEPITAEFEIEKVACPGISSGVLTIVPSGGVAPYTITWDWDGTTGTSLSNIPFGTYSVSVVDANGCSQSFIGEMQEAEPQLRMPTGYNPSDGLYQGISNCEVNYKLMIYNKWGQLLFVGTDGWDGKFNGEEAPMGTYTYMIEYSFNLEGQILTKQQRGIFTLVR